MSIRVTPGSEQIPLNIVGSSSFGDYPKISPEKTYNMFESDGFLVPFPGYHKVLELNPFAIEGRGLYRSFRGDRIIAVVDSQVYDIDTNLSARLVGTINTLTGEVFMDENLQQQIAIVDGLNLWIYNYTLGTLTLQTGNPLSDGTLVPNYVSFHNTYFLIGNANMLGAGNNWFSYAYASPTTVTMHTEMSLETKPDTAQAVVRIPGQASNVLVLGGSVAEVHTQIAGLNPTGGAQDYQRNNSISIDDGVLSVSTIAQNDEYIVWLGINEGNMPSINAMRGQNVETISTDGIDFFFQGLSHPEQSTAMMYRLNGHLFYHLTFFNHEDNVTLIYDFNVKKFYHLSDQNLDHHPARKMVFFNGNTQFNPALDNVPQNIFFISLNGGHIYQLSQEFTDINEDINSDLAAGTDPNLRYEMQRIRICKNVRFPTSAPFKVNQLCFTIEQGLDNIDGIQDCLIYLVTEFNVRIFSEKVPGAPKSYVQLVPEFHGQEDCAARPYQGRIDLAISKDGGETFSNYVPRYLNTLGNHKNILRWNKMGRVNDFVPKIRFWTLGRVVATDGYVEVTP